MGTIADRRIAGAPISWGVCEVPGWGLELPPERVLGEMAALGLRATELGPVGYLPDEPEQTRELLERFDLRLVAGFVPVVLHDVAARTASLEEAGATARRMRAAGAELFVSAIVVDAGWSPRFELDADAWGVLLEGLELLTRTVEDAGLAHVLHPHVGTLVEQQHEVRRVLEHSDVDFCLDSGHLVIGGTDPARFANEAGDRVRHVHLKDVDGSVAARFNAGELSLVAAVQHGLFVRLGEGVARVHETVSALRSGGYDGWYVLEQDVALTGGEPAAGTGPMTEVRRNLDHLRALLAEGR